jgi:hypothetical protein
VRPALARALEDELLRWRDVQIVDGERDVAIHRHEDVELLLDWEAGPDLVEERLGRLGEVAPIVEEALHRVLAGIEHALAIAPLGVLDDEWRKFPVDRAAELVHGSIPPDRGLQLTRVGATFDRVTSLSPDLFSPKGGMLGSY